MSNRTAIRFGYPHTLIREYEHWIVLLREQQVTLGSLVLCTTSEATAFASLPADAYTELGTVVQDIERVLGAAVEYEKINYLMLMMSDPNVHFHVLPRYPGSRTACGLTVDDHGWPAAPDLKQTLDLDTESRSKLCAYLGELW